MMRWWDDNDSSSKRYIINDLNKLTSTDNIYIVLIFADILSLFYCRDI